MPKSLESWVEMQRNPKPFSKPVAVRMKKTFLEDFNTCGLEPRLPSVGCLLKSELGWPSISLMSLIQVAGAEFPFLTWRENQSEVYRHQCANVSHHQKQTEEKKTQINFANTILFCVNDDTISNLCDRETEHTLTLIHSDALFSNWELNPNLLYPFPNKTALLLSYSELNGTFLCDWVGHQVLTAFLTLLEFNSRFVGNKFQVSILGTWHIWVAVVDLLPALMSWRKSLTMFCRVGPATKSQLQGQRELDTLEIRDCHAEHKNSPCSNSILFCKDEIFWNDARLLLLSVLSTDRRPDHDDWKLDASPCNMATSDRDWTKYPAHISDSEPGFTHVTWTSHLWLTHFCGLTLGCIETRARSMLRYDHDCQEEKQTTTPVPEVKKEHDVIKWQNRLTAGCFNTNLTVK